MGYVVHQHIVNIILLVQVPFVVYCRGLLLDLCSLSYMSMIEIYHFVHACCRSTLTTSIVLLLTHTRSADLVSVQANTVLSNMSAWCGNNSVVLNGSRTGVMKFRITSNAGIIATLILNTKRLYLKIV